MTDTPTRATTRAARPRAASGGWSKVQVGWPVVAIIGLSLGSIVAILALVPESDGQGRSVLMLLVQAVISILTGLFVARRVENAVERQQQQPEPDEQPERPDYRPYRPDDDRGPPRLPYQ